MLRGPCPEVADPLVLGKGADYSFRAGVVARAGCADAQKARSVLKDAAFQEEVQLSTQKARACTTACGSASSAVGEPSRNRKITILIAPDA